MTNSTGEDTVEITCNQAVLSEFPNLLFGTQTDTGISYFDATIYLQDKSQDLSVASFLADYKVQIEKLCTSYGTESDQITKISKQGHTIINGSLIYLWLSYTEPYFLAYMCDTMDDLLTKNVAVSDSYLYEAAKQRIPKEILKQLADNENSGI